MESESEDKNSRIRWDSPILVTVITAVLGIIGTGAAAVFKGYYEVNLEKQKFESNLIFKALEPEDAHDRAKYLLFLADAGLIDSLDVNRIREVAEAPESIPSSHPSLKLQSAKDILALSASVPGEITVEDNDVWKRWSDGNIVYAASRLYIKGRILAFGHDDILRLKGNEKDIEQSLNWLSGASKNKVVAFSTGNCEWVPSRSSEEEREQLYSTIKGWGFDVKKVEGELAEESLKGIGVLVIGNAWGSISQSEITAIKSFVARGGGLFTAGLGWSWKAYGHKDSHKCTGNTEGQIPEDLATYPMNRVMKEFGASWTGTYIHREK